jgi:hypothetical protein
MQGSVRLDPLRLFKRFTNCILKAADGILDLALGFLGLAFGFRLFVSKQLSRGFLETARDLLERSFDAILIHDQISLRWVRRRYWPTLMESSDPRTPNALSSQSMTAMTTTTFMMVLILWSIGIYVLAAHSKTPTTIRTMTTVIKGIFALLVYR